VIVISTGYLRKTKEIIGYENLRKPEIVDGTIRLGSEIMC